MYAKIKLCAIEGVLSTELDAVGMIDFKLEHYIGETCFANYLFTSADIHSKET